jgi:predicted Zn-dependent protease
MRLPARHYDGTRSSATAVEIEIGPDGCLWLFGTGLPRCHPLGDVVVSPRLGNVPRELRLPDGALCEVADNDALDAALAALGHVDGQDWIHRLERHWGWALAGVAGVALALAAAFFIGVPALARVTAAAIPPDVDRALGEQALEALDGWVLQPTQLGPEGQAQWREEFGKITADVPGNWNFRLEFRASQQLGANALALPSGIVIVTDDMLRMADSDNEIIAVMAHEVGHVVHRHTVRMLLQQSVTGLLALVVVGDISSMSTLVAALPATLITARHSRDFESEADDFAYAWLDQHHVPRRYFATILERLEAESAARGDRFTYFSSHPATADRVTKGAAGGD